ncbi:unnamed protein product [Tuber aestivum]|uniref:Uncharacterized protein n=1 Tax=Tuber aestivum TaxID=59557 RepID=A0A292Q3N2_9PEZI|nr:unnamed protein product [Tuber aestivum]
MRIPHSSEFPETPTPDASHIGIPLRWLTRNETDPEDPRDQSTYNTTLTPPSISNTTPILITPKYYPGSPPQLLPSSGVPTVRHPPQCTPNFEEACKTIQSLERLLREVRLLQADTFFGNPYWSDLNLFCKDFERFLSQESDFFFIFVGGASVATDADLEGLRIVAQAIFDEWSGMKKAVLTNNPGEEFEDEDAIVFD